MTVILNEASREGLFRAINGAGGAQDFLLQLQGQFNAATNELTYSQADLEKAREIAAWAGGSGGFQSRMRKIFGSLL